MLKLQVSESWIMSSLQAAMRRERERVGRWGMRESLESGGEREVVGVKGVFGDREAVGKRKELKMEGIDLVV
jgi:hypothetical protein